MAGRLADLAAETAIPRRCGVIKTIGDAVMLVSPDATALVLGALDLVAAAADQGGGFPTGALDSTSAQRSTAGAIGTGHPVNVASRVTGVAQPGSVLATTAVRDAVDGEAVRWSEPATGA